MYSKWISASSWSIRWAEASGSGLTGTTGLGGSSLVAVMLGARSGAESSSSSDSERLSGISRNILFQVIHMALAEAAIRHIDQIS